MAGLRGREIPGSELRELQSGAPSEAEWVSSVEPNAYWEPKHKVFLSHSGAQKDFTRHLFVALKNVHHSPFLDVDADSLTKGEEWYPTLMEAAKQCRVAVLVLSDEFFTRSKWPMMELNEIAKAQNSNLKILPLFLKISWKRFDEDKKGKRWFEKWKAMKGGDARIDLSEWEQALSIIKKYAAISYENEGEPAFIKKVVKAICKLVEPDVKFDVPENESIRRMCSAILQELEKIARSPKDRVHVMGVYGVGGIGKTTISRAICNQKFKDFGGKVCHVEFGSKNCVELQKMVLQELTQADSAILDNQHAKFPYLLKKRMDKQRVFLVLDNVQGHDVDEVMMYLNVGYMDGSIVLITSRSQDILVQELRLRECDCLEMPQLDAKGAVDVFLYYIGCRFDNKVKNTHIRRYVDECCFVKQGNFGSNFGEISKKHYLPLALKVLGSQLQSITHEAWGLEKYLEKYMEKLEVYKFNMLRERKHPIFSMLRLGYDALCLEDQYIFMDLALLWTPRSRSWKFELGFLWEWMCTIHRKTKDGMKESVHALKRNGLVDIDFEHDEIKCNIHDLFIDFAEAEARSGPFDRRQFLIDNKGIDVPFELLKNSSGSCWQSLERLVIRNNTMQSLKKAKLNLCSNVEVLQLYGCEELVEVDVGGLENLRSMEVVACKKFGQSIHEVEKLSNLIFFHMAHCDGPIDPQFFESLSSLTSLVVLNLQAIPLHTLLDLSNLKRLKVIILTHCVDLINLGNLIGAPTLQKLNVYGCENLEELPDDLSGLKQLEELDVGDCIKLKRLVGIGCLGALRKLNARGCKSLEELPDDLSGLKQLEELDVRYCNKLKSLSGIGCLGALRKLNASGCKSLEELPDDLSGLKKLEELDVWDCSKLKSLSGIGCLGALRKLNAWGCENLELPDDLSGLKQLEELDVRYCSKLKSLSGIGCLGALRKLNAWGCENLELPDDLSGLKQLEELDVRYCSKLKSLSGIGCLGALRKLNAWGCGNLELPDDLSGLKQLEELDVWDCIKLKRLVGIGCLGALRKLNARGCKSLEELPDDLSGLKQLEELDVRYCSKLKSLSGIGCLGALRKLNASGCKSLEELLDDLSGLKQLEELDVRYCSKLKSLSGIGCLGALRKLNAWGCGNLELPDDLSGLKQLEELDVWDCIKLKRLVGIGCLGALRKLNARGCKNLEELPDDLSGLKQLEELDVRYCSKLKSLSGIGCLGALRKLNASGCKSLEELLDDLSGLKQLEELDVRYCSKLKSLSGIGCLGALRKLNALRCGNLELPDDLSGLKQLEELDVRYCSKLKSLSGIGCLGALRKLNAWGCENLELSDDLSGLKQLEELDVWDCSKLKSLSGIGCLGALRKLNAWGCKNLEELPDDLSGLKQLEELDVRDCIELKRLVGIGCLGALRKLNARGCESLEELPNDLSGLKQLEELDVWDCSKLKSLSGIGCLGALRKLNVWGCKNLEELPDDLSGLKQLEELDVGDCIELKRLVGIGCLGALRKLNARGCESLEELPDDLSGLKQLEELDVWDCSKLKSLSGIGCLGALRKLNAWGCKNLEELPDDLSGLKQLEELDVGDCIELKRLVGIGCLGALRKLNARGCESLEELPDDLSGLKQLEELDVRYCSKLKSLSGIGCLGALRKLNAQGCKSLEELPDDLSGLKQLEELDVRYCSKLKSLSGIGCLGALRKLNAWGCKNLEELLDDLSGLKQLEELDVGDCIELKRLVGIGCLGALRKLNARGCESLEELPDDLSGLKQLEELDVRYCSKLKSLSGIGCLGALRKLNAWGCKNLEELLDDLSGLKQLEELDVGDCIELKRLVGIGCLGALRKLNARGCESLEELPDDLSGLKQLEELDVRYCSKLKSLSGIGCLGALRKLNAWGCKNLEELLDDLSGLKQLEELDVGDCIELKRLVGIGCLGALRKLNARGCESLEELPDDLSGLKQLEELDVRYCSKLKSLSGIGCLGALRKLNAQGCKSLEELPDDLSGLKQLEELDVRYCSKLKRLSGSGSLGALPKLSARRCESLEELPDDLSGLKQLEEFDLGQTIKKGAQQSRLNRADSRWQTVAVEDVEFQVEKSVLGQTGRPNLIGDKLQIDLTKDLLGVSSTGYVIRTSCYGTEGQAQPCALKRIDVMDRNGSDLARLYHPHVVQLIDYWIEEKFSFLIMELMDGDLAKLMAKTKKPRASPFTLHVTVDLMLQIALGMRHLHEMGVSHPHLKCENVLYRAVIKAEAYQVGDVLVKLGGFGWSRPADVPSKNQDVVCFGQTCLEILTGNVNSEMVPKSSIPETTPDVLKDCIVSCLSTHTTFANVVEELLRAKSHILQFCKDETICSSEIIQTQSVPTKTDASLVEIFTVHQLHPQSGDASTSIRATLVFFHGFHKVPEEWRRTWMTRDNKLVWPQTWLPEDLGSQSIRVLSVSFDANSNVSNKYDRHEIGKNLVERLILSPRWKLGEIGEAIFLMGHSFGGVLIKSFVTEAQKNAQEQAECMKFLKNLAEVVFYSVPHAAVAAEEFEDYISACRKVVPLQRSSFLQSLREDTGFITDMRKLSVDFEVALPENVKVLAFLEGKPMSMKRILVTEKSFEGLSRPWEWHKVDKDNHFEVSRPESRNHIGYKILLDHLQQYMK